MPLRRPSLNGLMLPLFRWGHVAALSCLAFGCAQPVALHDPAVETIVFVRHGEKPDLGLGQINCRGLNRSLALAHVLPRKFGPANFIFAPNPSDKTHDPGGEFYYLRPLATIEPTAVSLGLPINTAYGFRQTDELRQELLSDRYAGATIYVAWEHAKAEQIARAMLAAGTTEVVPRWESADFDSIYVISVNRNDGAISTHFTHDHEGLDNQPSACP